MQRILTEKEVEVNGYIFTLDETLPEDTLQLLVISKAIRSTDEKYQFLKRLVRQRHGIKLYKYRKGLLREKHENKLQDPRDFPNTPLKEFYKLLPEEAFDKSRYKHPSFFILDYWEKFIAQTGHPVHWPVDGIPDSLPLVCRMIRDHPQLTETNPKLYKSLSYWIRMNFQLNFRDFKKLFLSSNNPFLRYLEEVCPSEPRYNEDEPENIDDLDWENI